MSKQSDEASGCLIAGCLLIVVFILLIMLWIFFTGLTTIMHKGF